MVAKAIPGSLRPELHPMYVAVDAVNDGVRPQTAPPIQVLMYDVHSGVIWHRAGNTTRTESGEHPEQKQGNQENRGQN